MTVRHHNRVRDLRGLQFGRWTVIRRATVEEERHYKNCGYWLCRCECGSEALVNSSMLKSGKSKSCGCLRREIMTGNHFAKRKEDDRASL